MSWFINVIRNGILVRGISALNIDEFHSYLISFTTNRNKKLKTTEIPSCRIIFEYVRRKNMSNKLGFKMCIALCCFLFLHNYETKNETFLYVFYSLKQNICVSTHWWNINYIRATCFGSNCNWYFINALICICCVLDSKIHIFATTQRDGLYKKRNIFRLRQLT